MARKADVPVSVLRSIETLFGCRADAVEVFEHSLFARAHLRAIATTRPGKIFLRGSSEEFFCNHSLMLHEYCHVLCQWRTGALTTWRYIVECIRRGYWNNRYEIEARRFAEMHLLRFRTLLKELPKEPEQTQEAVRQAPSRAALRGDTAAPRS